MLIGRTILVADDNLINQRIVKILLEKQGAHVLAVSNGAEAVEVMKTTAVDVVLMDLNMPVMDGFEATEYIRKVLKSDVIIFGLSADIMTERELLLKAGMNDSIAKPLDPVIFNELVLKYLKK
jgi:CheY-like chemotaxis protein